MPTVVEILKGLLTADPTFMQWYMAHGRLLLDFFHLIFDQIFYVFLTIAIAFTAAYLAASIFTILYRKKEKEHPFIPAKAPTVTIQIPTRNEIIALRCAEKCLAFDYPKDRFEILIGDDSDKTEVSEALAAFAAKHDQVHIIKRAHNVGFKPGNLNNMLQHSTGDILVIFDSDFEPEPDFLKRIVTPFIHDPAISAVQAKWNFNNFDQNMVSMLGSTIVYIFHHIVLNVMALFKAASLCGSAEAIKKEDLIALGGWVSGSLTEDIEYSLRLHKHKKRIVYLPTLECYNEAPFVATDLYKQQMRWAYGVISAYKTHAKDLITVKGLSTKQRLLSFFAGFGYCMPMLIAILFITGTLSFVTHRPGPIDIPRFLEETARNVLLTSGLLFATLVALYKEKKIKYVIKTLLSSFSIGLVTTFYVNKGICKSFLGKPMQWYLLNKNSAQLRTSQTSTRSLP